MNRAVIDIVDEGKIKNMLMLIEAMGVISKYVSKYNQIFFQEKIEPITLQPMKIKEPVTFYVDSIGILNEIPLESVDNVSFSLVDGPQFTIINGNQIRTEFSFTLSLLARYENNIFEMIKLPSDIGTKVMTKYDLTKKQVAENPTQTMQWVGDRFIYTITNPLSSFDKPIPPEILGNDNLKENIVLKNMMWSADIGEISFYGTGSPPVLSTEVDLGVDQDLYIMLELEEEILIDGEVQ